MFFSRWTLFQALAVLLLAAMGFVADSFKQDISVSAASNSAQITTTMVMIALFIVASLALFGSLLYFQAKKSDTFLQGRSWDHMHILMPILLLFAVIGFSVLFFIPAFNAFMQQHRWLLYICLYLVLFLVNMTVLAIIHKTKRRALPAQTKVIHSFAWTSAGILIAIFLL